MKLAANVGAMLIAFIALVSLVNGLIGLLPTGAATIR
jgi:nucleoside permease NupC